MTTNSLKVKRASLGDPVIRKVIVALNLLLAREIDGIELDPKAITRGIEAQGKDSSLGRYYVAQDGKKVVGMCRIWFEHFDWENVPIWWFATSIPSAVGKESSVQFFSMCSPKPLPLVS